jgi:hypothetical protein
MSDAERRLSHSEREAAIAALQAHLTAGRLDSSEYEDRAVRARQARTRADLAPLFTDLPQPGPRWDEDDSISATAPDQPGPGVAGPPRPATAAPVPGPAPERHGGLLPEPWGAWVMSLTPIAALVLFFGTGYHWQWFLAVPVAGLIVYGPEGRSGDRGGSRSARDRDRRRGR